MFERGRAKERKEASGASDDERTLNLTDLEQDIKSLRGIGEKRAVEIMGLIRRHLGLGE